MTPSKLNSARNMSKLNDFKYLYNRKWDVLMELCLKEYQSKQSPGVLISANQPTGLQDYLHLDIDHDFNDNDNNGIVVPAAAVGENLSNDGFDGSI